MSGEKLNERISSFLNSAIKNLSRKEYDDALEDLQAAEVLDSENPQILYNMAVIYSKKGLFRVAINYYKKLLNLSFSFIEIITVNKMYTYALIMINNYSEAISLLKKSLKLVPTDTTILNMLAYCYEKADNLNESIKILKKILDIDKDNINANNSLGFLLAKVDKDMNAALLYAKKAFKNNPDNPAYLDTLGFIYFKKQQPDMAKKFLKKALEKAPYSEEIREHLNLLLKI